MHPNRVFHDLSEDTALDLADRVAFAHIFAATEAGPIVAHAPIARFGGQAFRFHLARGNRLTAHLDGARVLLSLVGPHGYVTPNWYQAPADQVPTWNYVAVELEGIVRPVGDEALTELLDRLAERHEPSPAPWTRAKMDPARFAAMLKAIRGFEVAVDTLRATNKLGQNKSAADRAGVIAGLEQVGNTALATALREAS